MRGKRKPIMNNKKVRNIESHQYFATPTADMFQD